MNTFKSLFVAALLMLGTTAQAQEMIQKQNIRLSSDRMTPEALWAASAAMLPRPTASTSSTT